MSYDHKKTEYSCFVLRLLIQGSAFLVKEKGMVRIIPFSLVKLIDTLTLNLSLCQIIHSEKLFYGLSELIRVQVKSK